jgi:hypothetical protein
MPYGIQVSMLGIPAAQAHCLGEMRNVLKRRAKNEDNESGKGESRYRLHSFVAIGDSDSRFC